MRTNKLATLSGLMLVGFTASLLAGDKSGVKRDSPTSPNQTSPPLTATNRTPVLKLPVIMYLESRDQTITVRSGPKGPLYSVKNAQGKVQFENLSLEQLRAQAPELHGFIKSALVGSGTSGVFMDASLRLPVAGMR